MGAGAWHDYLDNFAAMAGTLFALVLTARGLLAGVGVAAENRERWYQVLDGVSSTYELAAAALFALFAGVPANVGTPTIHVNDVAVRPLAAFAMLVAVLGITLTITTWISFALAWPHISKWTRAEGAAQSVFGLLPLVCYLVCLGLWLADLSGLRLWPQSWIDSESAIAVVVSWLTISGTIQAVVWSGKTWHRQLSPESSTTPSSAHKEAQ